MRVSLRLPSEPRSALAAAGPEPLPLLDPRGPELLLGSRFEGFDLTQPVRPTAATLFGPRGAALAGGEGPLFIADTGHRHLLIWHRLPSQDYTEADALIGQVDFTREGRNGKDEASPATFNVPTGIAANATTLAVADAWHHGVLIWHGLPSRHHQPADVVLGQTNVFACEHNRAHYLPDAASLKRPYACAAFGDGIVVADTANSRLLGFAGGDLATGATANRLSGQPDFHAKGDNRWDAPERDSLCWPMG